ncbi:hypothetical protein ACRQ5Q_29035 [Bradyrhizobium sp. PMVTL-01]
MFIVLLLGGIVSRPDTAPTKQVAVVFELDFFSVDIVKVLT